MAIMNNINISSKNDISLNKKSHNKNTSFSGASKAVKEVYGNIDGYKKGINNVIKGVDPILKETSTERPPLVLKAYAELINRVIAPIAEKIAMKGDAVKKDPNKVIDKLWKLDAIVLLGNAAKELCCMIFYPTMTMVNQDLPTDKKRFVGIYDFFVTCFSLGGTLLFGAKKTKEFTDKIAQRALFRYRTNSKFAKATSGLLFVTSIGLQTLLCKRILAPALSPPLAASARKKLEANDAKKAAAANGGVAVQQQQPQAPVEKAPAPEQKTESKTAEKPVMDKNMFELYKKTTNKTTQTV